MQPWRRGSAAPNCRGHLLCMYVCENDYIAVSIRTLTPPTTGTELSKARSGASRGHNPAVLPLVPFPPKATDGQPNQACGFARLLWPLLWLCAPPLTASCVCAVEAMRTCVYMCVDMSGRAGWPHTVSIRLHSNEAAFLLSTSWLIMPRITDHATTSRAQCACSPWASLR